MDSGRTVGHSLESCAARKRNIFLSLFQPPFTRDCGGCFPRATLGSVYFSLSAHCVSHITTLTLPIGSSLVHNAFLLRQFFSKVPTSTSQGLLFFDPLEAPSDWHLIHNVFIHRVHVLQARVFQYVVGEAVKKNLEDCTDLSNLLVSCSWIIAHHRQSLFHLLVCVEDIFDVFLF